MTQPMISQPQPAEPAPINPTITAGLLVGAFAKLDTLESTPRALHNFLQDDFLPIVRRMHEELTTTMHFVGMHEDRIGALEDGEGGGLHPEDAEQLLDFLTKAVEAEARPHTSSRMGSQVRPPSFASTRLDGTAQAT